MMRAQPGIRHAPAQSPARPHRRKRAHRAELRLVGSQAQRPPCASQRDGPRPRYRRCNPLGLARAGKRAPPSRVVAGTPAGAALLSPHAAAKRGYARTRDQAALRQRDHASAVEASLITLHAALYLTVVLWVLFPLKALAFIAVQQAVFSLYLGISFAPNHKGMPIIETATATSFARRQVVTARNIRGGRFTTFMLGGLNYRIEHHLFPSMPRPNLRRVQGLVRDFCAATDLGCSEESFVESFRQIVHHPSEVRAASRAQAPLVPGGAARSSAAGGGDRRADGRYRGRGKWLRRCCLRGHARRRRK